MKKQQLILISFAGILLILLGFLLGKLTTKTDSQIIIPTKVESCVIHSFSAETPLLINTSTGYVGELRIYPRSSPYFEQSKPYGVMTTGHGEGFHYFSFPDNDYLDLSISQENIEKYDISLAATHLCADCLNEIQNINTSSNYVIALVDGDSVSIHSIDEVKEGFTDFNYTFTTHEGNKDTFGFKMTYTQ